MTRHDDPEDVLSSIRRLVAGEDAGSGDGSDARPPILLLGPAVRVTEPEGPFQRIHHGSGLKRETGSKAGPGAGGEDAALRALVAAVVREELAGELGERITRNLRQLVLREIRAANGIGTVTRTETGPDA